LVKQQHHHHFRNGDGRHQFSISAFFEDFKNIFFKLVEKNEKEKGFFNIYFYAFLFFAFFHHFSLLKL
jgi:hypothetical protein